MRLLHPDGAGFRRPAAGMHLERDTCLREQPVRNALPNRIDTLARFGCNILLGILRSPHEATCPSIASRISCEGASMSSPTTISSDKLARLIGTANMPVLIDVRTDEDFAA